jgi:hypothetical protein
MGAPIPAWLGLTELAMFGPSSGAAAANLQRVVCSLKAAGSLTHPNAVSYVAITIKRPERLVNGFGYR